jgi:cell division protein FtsQ
VRLPGAALLGLGPLPDDDLIRDDPQASGYPGYRARSPWWRRGLWLVAIAALAAGIGWVVALSPVLGVRQVSIRGEALLTEDQIRAAADIVDGTPLVRLDTDAIRARLEGLPEVESARVSVSYPSTVSIDVVERTAVGYRGEADGIRVVDGTGVAFRAVPEAPPGLPQLPAPPPAGQWNTAQAAAAVACAEVAAALPRPIQAQVARIEATTANSVQLNLADGRTIIWGGAVRNEQKALLLAPLLGRDGSVFDISAEGVVVVR